MRRLLITLVLLSTTALVTPASALQAGDTMSAWKSSSEKDRSDLLKQLFGDRGGDNGSILKCMNDTSKTPGHMDLSIGDVAKVCASSGVGEQPV